MSETMGMFGHVPTPAEIEAKAFVTSAEPWAYQWSWAAYCTGLSDAGVPDVAVAKLIMAACKGEFTGNVSLGGIGDLDEPDWDDDPDTETDDLEDTTDLGRRDAR